MSKTSDGTQDQPQFASSGNTPTFAADLTLISDFFAARSFRRFTTVALLLASSGSSTDAYAIATNAPGAFFRKTGSGWTMFGVAQFADSAASATAIASPVAGMRRRLATRLYDEEYLGSTPGWRPVGTEAPLKPTSVVGGTLRDDGRVTFSGAASVSLVGLNASDFEVVKFIIRTTSKATAGVVQARLRSGGTDETDTNYSHLRAYQFGTSTTTPAHATGQDEWELDAGAQVRSLITLELANMGQALATDGKVTASGAPTLYETVSAVANSETNAYDGITFLASTGTFTGWVQAIGIR